MAPDEGPNYHADDPPDDNGPGNPQPIHTLAKWIHEIADAHGFWPPAGRNVGELIALIHSEASEALDEHRSGKPAYYHKKQAYGPDKPEGVLVEYMDIVIRTLDAAFELAEREGIVIDEVLFDKIRFNESRPHKHGRKY